jgi:hypothetical protein
LAGRGMVSGGRSVPFVDLPKCPARVCSIHEEMVVLLSDGINRGPRVFCRLWVPVLAQCLQMRNCFLPQRVCQNTAGTITNNRSPVIQGCNAKLKRRLAGASMADRMKDDASAPFQFLSVWIELSQIRHYSIAQLPKLHPGRFMNSTLVRVELFDQYSDFDFVHAVLGLT